MIRDVATVRVTGRQVTWDGTNLDEVREVAGNKFRGAYDTMVIVENASDDRAYLVPGWTVTRLETGAIITSSPGGADVLFREIIA